MRIRLHHNRRRGAVLPLVAMCLIGLIGLVALAIDIGMIAVAHTQAQLTADSSAMAGARTISGNSATSYNYDNIPINAIRAANANFIFGNAVTGDPNTNFNTSDPAEKAKVHPDAHTYQTGQVKVEVGSYNFTYNDADPTKESFKIAIPRSADTEPYSAVRSTITFQGNYAFGKIFGMNGFNTTAASTAIHRPRDVVIIMDLSGSMRFQSMPGIPYTGSRTTSMNPDAGYPQFGHYFDTNGAALSTNASLPTGGGEYYDPANISVKTNSGDPILEFFFKNAANETPSSANRAFARTPNTLSTAPNGDNFLKVNLNTGGTYTHTVKEFNNNSTNTIPKFEVNGYGQYQTFNGYTEGPGYWGKTFWVWPPNPGGLNVTPAPSLLTNTAFNWYNNGSRDWRQRFFVAVKNPGGSPTPAWICHNSILFDGSGLLKTPGTTTSVTENGTSNTYTYRINYAAILYWLQQNPVHFPSTVQAGRIRYYTAIPSGTDNTLNNRWWTTAPKDLYTLDGGGNKVWNERFWKDYIDFVLGFTASDTTAISYSSARSYIGGGTYYTWTGSSVPGGTQTHPQPQPPSTDPSAPYMTGSTGPYSVSSTARFYQGNTSANAASAATTVSVGAIPSGYVTANTNYVTFNGSTANKYLITAINGTRTQLTISPGLSSAVSSGSTFQLYSTNNASGKTFVSVNNPGDTLTANSDYVGFNNNIATANLYKFTAAGTKGTAYQLTLPGGGLATAVNLTGDSVQYYPSNGASGSTTLSVTGLSSAPVVNRDYAIINNDTANPYLITAAASKTNGYVLTISPGLAAAVNVQGASVKVYSPYMDYSDDVRRPKHHFWFGPLTWVDWLGNYNTGKLAWPGNVPEAQAWACKAGIQTAIDDIKNNHPSDYIGLCYFSSPAYVAGTSGQYNAPAVPLGRDYQKLKDSLWFPPSTIVGGVSEITPYDSDFRNVPRANGGTSPGMGFMLAYNLLSSSATNLRNYPMNGTASASSYKGTIGGLGRRGASRLVIFETDGAPNTRSITTLEGTGKDQYYKIRVFNPANLADTNNTEWPADGTSYTLADTTKMDEVYGVVKQICKLDTDGGHATKRKPVQVYALGYGSLFDTANSGGTQNNGLTFLQTVQFHGNTATTTAYADFPPDQRIYGPNEDVTVGGVTTDGRITRMQKAFTKIMQAGVQVSLIE